MLNFAPLIIFLFFFKIFFIANLYILVFRVLTILYYIHLNFREIVHISVSGVDMSAFFQESGSFTFSQLIPFFLLDHPVDLEVQFSLLSFIMVQFSVSVFVSLFSCNTIAKCVVCKTYALYLSNKYLSIEFSIVLNSKKIYM